MSTQYVTLKQSEPDFLKYLWGLNENGKLALPVKTYNVGTPEECVTFEVREKSRIEKPQWFFYFAALIKLRSFILILLPLFYVLTKNQIQMQDNDPVAIILATVAMLLLFAGLNIRNDLNDHLSGYDRVNLDASVKPIRMGWVTARQLSRWSLVLVGLAAIVAAPVVILHWQLLYVLGISLLLFVLGRFAKRNSYKHQHFGEVVLFMLAGPALVAGYQISSGAPLDTEVLSFGALWGFAVLFLVQVNNFAHIMTSSQSGIKNTMTKLGFDLSQKFLMTEWLAAIVLFTVFHVFFGHWVWAVVGSLILMLLSFPLLRQLNNIKSPMGSSLQSIRKQANVSFLALVALFAAENLVRLWLA